MLDLLPLIPLFPLLGFLVLVGSQGKLPMPIVPWVGAGSVGLSALLAGSIGATYLSVPMKPYSLHLWTWMQVGNFYPGFSLYLDALSLVMVFVVTGVGFLIHVYSAGFMRDDPGYARFFAYMNLFVAAMLVLVLADNLMLLYFGWEGVGLCSYLLIGFWYEEPGNGLAARKAFVVTRVGDTALALGLFLLFTQLGTLDIQPLMYEASATWKKGDAMAVAAALLLLGGAVGKSAQLPLQTWLPDAMAGPTPISALIHAATMVTAGVYLIARMHGLFELAPEIQRLVALIGAATLLMAGCTALMQTDIKRILAYSTISQIGYMFLALGVGAWSAAIFHLMTHAYFKALLFLAAGAVIHCYQHEHNIFRMGGLRKGLPIAFWSFVVGSAALSAVPLSSGYFSKHEILLAAYSAPGGAGLWAAGVLGAFLTGLYSFRLVFVAFCGRDNTAVSEHLGFAMGAPLIVLCLLTLLGGLVMVPLESVFPASAEHPEPHRGIQAVTTLTPFLGIGLAVLCYLTHTISPAALLDRKGWRALRAFWFSGWGFDRLYWAVFATPFTRLAELNRRDVVDSVFRGLVFASVSGYRLASSAQTGQLRWYAGGLVAGAVLIIALGVWT